MFRSLLCVALFLSAAFAEGAVRPRTFSLAQEETLADYPKVLSFLYYMTRKQLNFEEMAAKYQLASVDRYRSFLADHNIVKSYGNGQLEFLFLNPHGVWSLQNQGPFKKTIIRASREQGLKRLQEVIGDKEVNDGVGAPLWIVNTLRLNREEFEQYKSEFSQLAKKYSELSEQHLLERSDAQVVWSMQLADAVPPSVAETTHMLFGKIEEFSDHVTP